MPKALARRLRSLVEDLGKLLGTGAYMSDLRRTQVGKFVIADAIVLPPRDQREGFAPTLLAAIHEA